MKKISYTVFFILTFGLLFAFFPEKGEAQSYRSFNSERRMILEETNWMIGPFRIFPTLRFTNVGYDGNVYYGREGDEPITDYTATISPEVKAYLLLEDYFIFSFTENPEYVYYMEQTRERRWNHNFSPEFKMLLLNRIVLGGSYSYKNRRYRATSEFSVRANELRKAYSGSVFYETPRETSFGFNYKREYISYEDVDYGGQEIYLSRILSRYETTYEGEIYYQVFYRNFLFINGGYTDYEFENVESQWRNSYSHQFYTGLRFPLLGRVIGQISIGYKELIPREEGLNVFKGIVGDTQIDYRTGRLRLRAVYRRDCRFSYWTNNNYYIDDRYAGGISFYLTKFLRLDYDYNYGEGHYPEKELVRNPDGTYEEIKREDIYTIHSLGFAVRIVETTGIGVSATWWDRDSNVFFADRERMFIGGYLTFDF